MKIVFVTVAFIFLALSRTNAQMPVLEENKNDKQEQKALARVKMLPEINDFFKTVPKASTPALLVNRTPDSTFKYYWIGVGISNLGRFRTSFHIYFDPGALKFYYLDFFDESGMGILPVETWRKWRGNPGFWKIHIFKHGKLVVLNDSDKKKGSSNKKR